MKVLITGGLGFIGCNLAKRFSERGDEIIIFDNLLRKGSEANLAWLQENGAVCLVNGDIRDYKALEGVFDVHQDIGAVFHLAAQVAVTMSVANPREDFEINALGTFNLLEAIREGGHDPVLIYSSTNKVYGRMEDLSVLERDARYEYQKLSQGVGEDRPLDFHSPYGCSKGAADQYVLDYSRIYGLRAVSFRQSCIYGYRQFGLEDQGWVAWFTIAAVLGKAITIYGDGKQVRDVLFIDDLVDLYILAVENIDHCRGKAYNIGGGPKNTLSLLELISRLENLMDRKLDYSFSNWRPGDQPVFICDIRRVQADLGWQPRVDVDEGIHRLFDWVSSHRHLFGP